MANARCRKPLCPVQSVPSPAAARSRCSGTTSSASAARQAACTGRTPNVASNPDLCQTRESVVEPSTESGGTQRTVEQPRCVNASPTAHHTRPPGAKMPLTLEALTGATLTSDEGQTRSRYNGLLPLIRTASAARPSRICRGDGLPSSRCVLTNAQHGARSKRRSGWLTGSRWSTTVTTARSTASICWAAR